MLLHEHVALDGRKTLAERLQSGSTLQLFAHTDTTGSESDNKELSDRRAACVMALLTHDVDTFVEVSNGEGWGLDVHQVMLRALECDPGPIDAELGELTRAAVERFQCRYVERAFHEESDPLREPEVSVRGTERLEAVAKGAEIALKVLDAINLVLAVRELHEISESNPKLRSEVMRDAIFQSLDLVKSVMDFALKDAKGVARLAPRILGTVLAARTAWRSIVKAHEALSYGDINAFAAMAVVSVTSLIAVGIAAVGQAGAAAGHFGAIVAAVGVLASLLYTWAKDTKLQTFVAHSSIGNKAFRSLSTGEPGWATVRLNKLASSWDSQLEALAALQGQFSLYTDATMHHQGADMNNVRLRPGVLGSGSRFVATWTWRPFGLASDTPLKSTTIEIEGAVGMLRDKDGLFIDLTIPNEVFDKGRDAGKPIPREIKLTVQREVYAADGVKVALPLHKTVEIDCIRTGKSQSEKINSIDFTKDS